MSGIQVHRYTQPVPLSHFELDDSNLSMHVHMYTNDIGLSGMYLPFTSLQIEVCMYTCIQMILVSLESIYLLPLYKSKYACTHVYE